MLKHKSPKLPFNDGLIGTTPGADAPSVAAIRLGAAAPDFLLHNADGDLVSLDERSGAAPVVLLFYRDGACPVCKAALRAYQRRAPTIRAAGARVIALSPESRGAALVTARDNDLDFEFLSDVEGRVADQFGITYKQVVDNRSGVATSLEHPDTQQASLSPLPVPASYVIGASRQVIAATDRPGGLLDPDDVITAIRTLAAST